MHNEASDMPAFQEWWVDSQNDENAMVINSNPPRDVGYPIAEACATGDLQTVINLTLAYRESAVNHIADKNKKYKSGKRKGEIKCYKGAPCPQTSTIRSCDNFLRFCQQLADGTVKLVKKNGTLACAFTLFAKGNSKLPFWEWSILPVVTCPGRGECEKWCYSLKAWCHPDAFFRRAQNTLLTTYAKGAYLPIIAEAFAGLPSPSVLRLHVDGDFQDIEMIDFWMRLIATRQPEKDDSGKKLKTGISCYCYTKSWKEMIAYDAQIGGQWPQGFLVNMSSGSQFDGPQHAGIQQQMSSLSCVRNWFVAVPTGDKPGPDWTEAQKREYLAQKKNYVIAALKAANPGKRVAACPGLCGCCPGTWREEGKKTVCNSPANLLFHMCGTDTPAMRQTVIGIAVH